MNSRTLFLLVITIILCGIPVESAKILGIFPAPGKSHYILGNVLLRGLAERGHEVTMISEFEDANLPKNYRNLKVKIQNPDIDGQENIFFTEKITNPFFKSMFASFAGGSMLESVLKNPQVEELLTSKTEKFDVVIVDQFVYDGFRYFAQHFGAHHVLLSSTSTMAWSGYLVGNPIQPSYIPEIMSEYAGDMNFFDRLGNAVFHSYMTLCRHFLAFPHQDRIIRKHSPEAPPMQDYIYNVSLVLINGHESYSDPEPLVPVMKSVGGFHVKHGGELPEDLQKFMDDATDGVIYFSFGSLMKSKDLPENVREAILRTFSKLKMKVLWKWEDDVLPNKPDNVEIRKWIPQREVLAHPNLKLFITHGGLLSTIEAIYFGVPLLAIPVFGDQPSNSAFAEKKGYALRIKFLEFTEEKFKNAIDQLLSNPKFKENAQMRSKLFHDRPMKPLDEAVYWVEYVIRHNGAEHLRAASVKLKWYQYILLDVVGFIFITLLVLFILTKLIVTKLCCKKRTEKLKLY